MFQPDKFSELLDAPVSRRQFLLVKPNYRFAGLARTEWQIFTYIAADHSPECSRYGSQSHMIFSGSRPDCLLILEGKEVGTREYRSGTKICHGHYTPSGVFIGPRIKATSDLRARAYAASQVQS